MRAASRLGSLVRAIWASAQNWAGVMVAPGARVRARRENCGEVTRPARQEGPAFPAGQFGDFARSEQHHTNAMSGSGIVAPIGRHRCRQYGCRFT